jgi:hypothetical protein
MYIYIMNQENLNTSLITIGEFREFMFDRIVPIDDILDAKGNKIEQMFPYWRKHEVIPFVPKGLKFEISFAQLFWLRILDQLRLFSYTIKNTQKICDYFFKDAYHNDLPKKNLEYNKEKFLKKKRDGEISEVEEAALKWIEEKIADEKFLYILKYDINYLTNLIIVSLEQKEQAGILIFLDGEVLEHIGDFYFNHNNKNLDRRKPHIYFSISYLLEEFINQEELQTLLLPQILSDEEKLVLKEIRTSNVKELVIKKDYAGELTTLYRTTERIITGEEVNKVKKIFGLGNYEELTLTTRNEKTIAFKKTKKERLR